MSGDAKQRRKAKREVEIQIANERRLRLEAEALAFEATRRRDELEHRMAKVELDRVYLRNSRGDQLDRVKQLEAQDLKRREALAKALTENVDLGEELEEVKAALAVAEERIAELEAQDRDAAKLRRRLKTAHDELKKVHQENRNLRVQIKAEEPIVSAADLLARIG